MADESLIRERSQRKTHFNSGADRFFSRLTDLSARHRHEIVTTTQRGDEYEKVPGEREDARHCHKSIASTKGMAISGAHLDGHLTKQVPDTVTEVSRQLVLEAAAARNFFQVFSEQNRPDPFV